MRYFFLLLMATCFSALYASEKENKNENGIEHKKENTQKNNTKEKIKKNENEEITWIEYVKELSEKKKENKKLHNPKKIKQLFK